MKALGKKVNPEKPEPPRFAGWPVGATVDPMLEPMTFERFKALAGELYAESPATRENPALRGPVPAGKRSALDELTRQHVDDVRVWRCEVCHRRITEAGCGCG